jgi:uncharacterized protein
MNLEPLNLDALDAAGVAAMLGLERLPSEGGFFRRVAEGAPILVGDTAGRRRWSLIHALFTPVQFSALHRLAVDEIWCFLAGDPLETVRLHPGGRGERVRLGRNRAGGARLTDVVAAGVWQGARVAPSGRWALVACTCVPEFRWEDFELGSRMELVAQFPAWGDAIAGFTRPSSAAT